MILCHTHLCTEANVEGCPPASWPNSPWTMGHRDSRFPLYRLLSCPDFLQRVYFCNRDKGVCVLRAEARGAACRKPRLRVCDVAGERGLCQLPRPQVPRSPGGPAGTARQGCGRSAEDSGPRSCCRWQPGEALGRALLPAAPQRFTCHPRGGARRCRPQQEDEEPGQAHCATRGCMATAKAECPLPPSAWAGRPPSASLPAAAAPAQDSAEGRALSPRP